jgi:PKD repeat protein
VAAATYSTSGTIVTFTNTSTNATSYSWDFGDFTNSSAASPSHAYTANGSYVVTLTATNGNCTDVYTMNISISASIEELSGITAVTLFPNPATDNVNLELNMRDNSTISVSIVDNSGKVVYSENKEVVEGQNVHSLTTSSLSSGYYNVVLSTENGVAKTIKLAINK